MSQILVVDDEIGIRELLSEILADEGHTVQLAENAAHARALSANASIRVRLEGHSDERGSPEYNIGLGERRVPW